VRLKNGCLSDGDDREELVIDEDAAVVFCRIFHSIIEGKRISGIAKAL
jgi:hypothetical protein